MTDSDFKLLLTSVRICSVSNIYITKGLIVNKMCYRFDSQNSAYLWIHFSNVTLKTAFTVAKLKKKKTKQKSQRICELLER